MKVAELIRMLEQDGWRVVRTKGSHRQFKNPNKPGTVTVAGKPSVEIPPGTLNSILKRIEEEGDGRMTRYMVVEHGDASWGAHVPDLPGCIAVGETRAEVVNLVREAIVLHIAELRCDGLPVPKPSSEGEFVEVEAA